MPFEDAANIGAWAEQHGCTVTSTQLYTGAPLPQIEEIDALAVMGGPMNVYQHRDHPWLLQEKRFLEQAIRAGIPTIGVCLGAQLVADVLGAKVVQNPHIEIGWFEVETVTESAGAEPNDHPPLPRDLPTRFMAFHWHGDTFEIPRGAIRIAQSRACRNQAFEYATRPSSTPDTSSDSSSIWNTPPKASRRCSPIAAMSLSKPLSCRTASGLPKALRTSQKTANCSIPS